MGLSPATDFKCKCGLKFFQTRTLGMAVIVKIPVRLFAESPGKIKLMT